jgi:hypothetical protein
MNQLIETNLNQEELFILFCCQKVSTDKPIGAIDDFLTKNLNWDFIVSIAGLHSLAGLLYFTLSQCRNIKFVPVEVLNKLKATYDHNVLKNLLYASEFNNILKTFNRAKIRIIPLKGIEFVNSIYAHNIALRNLSDIDILVENKNVVYAEKNLLEMGYKRKKTSFGDSKRCFHSIFWRSRGNLPITIELHWDVDYNDSPFRIDIGALWARSREISSGKINCYGFSIEDSIMFNSFHILREIRRGPDVLLPLKNLCDIATIITQSAGQINWDYIVQRSKEYNVIRPVLFVLMLVRELLSIGEIPRIIFEAIRDMGYKDTFIYSAVKEYIFPAQDDEIIFFPFWTIELSDQETLWGKAKVFIRFPKIILQLYNHKYYGDLNPSVIKTILSLSYYYTKKILKTMALYILTPHKAIMLHNKMALKDRKTLEVINWIREQ